MPAYVVARITVTDPAWVEEYVPAVNALVESHGGRYIVRSPDLEVLEESDPPPGLIALIEFPSRESAHAFYSDPAYERFLDARKAGSDSEIILVDGL